MTKAIEIEIPSGQSKSVHKNSTNELRLNSKSTAIAAQYERVLRMLNEGEKSTIELRQGGVIAPAARTKELREKLGYNIQRTRLCSVWDGEGYCHRGIAFYARFKELESEVKPVSFEANLD